MSDSQTIVNEIWEKLKNYDLQRNLFDKQIENYMNYYSNSIKIIDNI